MKFRTLISTDQQAYPKWDPPFSIRLALHQTKCAYVFLPGQSSKILYKWKLSHFSVLVRFALTFRSSNFNKNEVRADDVMLRWKKLKFILCHLTDSLPGDGSCPRTSCNGFFANISPFAEDRISFSPRLEYGSEFLEGNQNWASFLIDVFVHLKYIKINVLFHFSTLIVYSR